MQDTFEVQKTQKTSHIAHCTLHIAQRLLTLIIKQITQYRKLYQNAIGLSTHTGARVGNCRPASKSGASGRARVKRIYSWSSGFIACVTQEEGALSKR